MSLRMLSDSSVSIMNLKWMLLVTIYKFFLVELCPWREGREVTKFYTGMLWPKVKDLSILQCFGQERLSMNE